MGISQVQGSDMDIFACDLELKQFFAVKQKTVNQVANSIKL